MYDLIDFKNNAIILQALVAIIFVVNMLCAMLKSNSTQYTYISSSIPELPDRRESGFNPFFCNLWYLFLIESCLFF